jgi:anti-sigma B factor antagonist
MEIKKDLEGSKLTIHLTGRLDTTSSPQLDDELGKCLDGISLLTIDCSHLDYISSAGLRVLLSTHKKMLTQGKMVVAGARDNEAIMEVFEITGFSDILDIE